MKFTDKELDIQRRANQVHELERRAEETELIIQITPDNAEERIREAIHTIFCHWDEWEEHAMRAACTEQNVEVGISMIEDQLGCVLQGMVFDTSDE